jgi:hypothetical protein
MIYICLLLNRIGLIFTMIEMKESCYCTYDNLIRMSFTKKTIGREIKNISINVYNLGNRDCWTNIIETNTISQTPNGKDLTLNHLYNKFASVCVNPSDTSTSKISIISDNYQKSVAIVLTTCNSKDKYYDYTFDMIKCTNKISLMLVSEEGVVLGKQSENLCTDCDKSIDRINSEQIKLLELSLSKSNNNNNILNEKIIRLECMVQGILGAHGFSIHT